MLKNFHQSNRNSLIQSLHGGLIILTAYTQMQRGADAAFAFEQEANFWWLTGIDAPDWWVIIDGARHTSWLVAPHVSEVNQIFDGSLTYEAAQTVSGIEAILTRDEATTLLHDLATRHTVVHTLGDPSFIEYIDFTLNPAPRQLHRLLERTFADVLDCQWDLAKLRAIKQPEEIMAIKKAIKLTMQSFADVKVLLPEFHYEYEIEAEFSYAFRRRGATGHAYDPIVASGANACTLHYGENNAKLKPRQLVLLDIGARVHGYAADISRTYAYGEPTKRQLAIHVAVQQAQEKIIKLLKPHASIATYYEQVDEIMKTALAELNLLASADDYRRYFPHAISHGLGIDVHDSLGRATEFLPGMVLTVEPGIYVPEEGIGVRIEDNILITETGHTNLSSALSKGL